MAVMWMQLVHFSIACLLILLILDCIWWGTVVLCGWKRLGAWCWGPHSVHAYFISEEHIYLLYTSWYLLDQFVHEASCMFTCLNGYGWYYIYHIIMSITLHALHRHPTLFTMNPSTLGDSILKTSTEGVVHRPLVNTIQTVRYHCIITCDW